MSSRHDAHVLIVGGGATACRRRRSVRVWRSLTVAYAMALLIILAARS
jgi:siroheme synthase (precorrin-2 oxidase/ferrochelatase)